MYSLHCGSSTVLEGSALLHSSKIVQGLTKSEKNTCLQHAVVVPDRALFPVITAVHASGHVIGLGVDLIYACDIRYSASNCI